MTLTDEQLEKIQRFTIEMDWNVAFDGKSRGNRHLFRVNRISGHLQGLHGGDPGIISAGAWLHDVGLIEGNIQHCFKGSKIARKFLEDLDVAQDEISSIRHCIEAHDGEVKARTIEAQIVHDADTIDKMGPLGAIRHVWKMANVDYHAYSVDELLEFIPSHLDERRGHLYLDSAVGIVDVWAPVLREFFDDGDRAAVLFKEVMRLAKDGVPTETIVDRLRLVAVSKDISGSFIDVLDAQMNLRYLEQ